jgi:NAD(P)-dependent dehydrogenase (short-subunit alcohol dehydrogenase family)
MADEDWFRVINVNLSGAFFCAQAALKHMVEQGNGRIIFVSSVIGEMGNIGQSNCGSLPGLVNFSQPDDSFSQTPLPSQASLVSPKPWQRKLASRSTGPVS